MSEPLKLGRRGFLGVGAAVAVGAGVAVTTGVGGRKVPARGEAVFDVTEGFPDRPVSIRVRARRVSDGAIGQVRLLIETPREEIVRDLGPVEFAGGEAALDAALVYPYDTRVAGTYRYRAEIIVDGARVVTATPAEYAVRPFHWFS